MRIAIYTGSFYPNIGGMEILCEILANEFITAGHDVLVLTDTPAQKQSQDKFSFPVFRAQTFLSRLRLFRSSDVILSFALSLRRSPEQLLSRRPIVVHHPNPLTAADGRTRLIDYAKHQLSGRLVNIVPSRYMATKIRHSMIIPNPYNHELFRYNGESKSSAVIFVGRLASIKGLDVLLRAIKIAFESTPTFETTIVGDGPEREHFVKLAIALGIHQHVRFVGPMRGHELATLMLKHTTMVVPSSYEEPFGIAALEGLASGCAMIVSKRGGLLDAVGPHALSFNNGSAEELARCLALCLREPSVRDRLLTGADQHLRAHRADIIAAQYLRVLQEAAGH